MPPGNTKMEKSKNLETTAQDIKHFYILRKRNPIGSSPDYSLKEATFWKSFEKAAKICMEINAYPYQYVDAHFHNRNPDQVFVTMLHSSSSKKIYEDYVAHEKPNYPELLAEYVRTLKRQIKLGRKVEWILNCDQIMFAAWFRICATVVPNKDIITKYKAAARAEINPELVEFLRTNKMDYKRITL
jgi:uncharacterized short protein YbdD (DUF466 family)